MVATYNFGSVYIHHRSQQLFGTMVGSPGYMATEI